MTTAGKIHAHIDSHRDEHLERVRAFLRQPSISADGTGIPEMVQLLVARLREVGAEAEVIPTPGHPVVYGELPGHGPGTLLLYGMYDVQPVAGEEWDVDPFSAAIEDLPPHGPCLVARGAVNTKGPLAGMLNALESVRAVAGAPPLTIKFLIEGEEELGSRHLPGVVTALRERLRADAGFFPMYRQDVTGKPIVHLGCKGVAFCELVARGGEWGGPVSAAVHGSRGVWFHNPAWWLVHALATLLSPDQTRVLVEGFSDGALPPDEEDEVLLAALEATFDARAQLRESGIQRFKYDLQGTALLRNYLFEPTINIDGLLGGYVGVGDKSVIPPVAAAKFDCRLVRRMRPERVAAALRRHLDQHGFAHLELRVSDAYPTARTSVRAPIVQALLETYRTFGTDPEVWPSIASSMPLYLFTEVLGLDMVSGGLGHGGRAHAANEYASVAGAHLFEKSIATLFYVLADRLVAARSSSGVRQ